MADGVGERLVEVRHDAIDDRQRVGPHDELVVLGADVRGHHARGVELVVRGLVEADREGLHRPRRASRHQRRRRGSSRCRPTGTRRAGTSLIEMRAHRVARAARAAAPRPRARPPTAASLRRRASSSAARQRARRASTAGARAAACARPRRSRRRRACTGTTGSARAPRDRAARSHVGRCQQRLQLRAEEQPRRRRST